MLLQPLAIATAGLAAATQAFLLPPEISQSDIDIVDYYTVPQYLDLNLPCPGCLVHTKGGHHSGVTASDKPSYLQLAFSIDRSFGYDRLLVNDFTLYPHANLPFIETLKARVLSDDEPAVWKKLRGHRPHGRRPRKLGFGLAGHEPVTESEDELALVLLDLQIIEVDDAFVNGIPNVHIKLVKDVTTGALRIGSIETTESNTAIATPMDEQEDCSTFMCKWFAVMKDNMAKIKGKPCHGKSRGGAKGKGKGPHPHHDHHHHHGHHGHHGDKTEGDAHHHSMSQLFKNIAAHILLPVALGIVAGVSVSVIGMLIGTLIVSVWRALFRRPSHRRSRAHSRSHHKASKKEIVVAEVEEKSGLLEHQDPPPSYEDEVVPKADI